nr:hrpY gene [Ralstonia solanacearum]
MLDAAKMQNALNRTQMLAKLMEAGPKAAKDLIS